MRVNILLLLLLFTGIGFCQNQKVMILDIQVEGNERLTSDDIIRSSRLFTGREVNADDIQKSIKTLWNLNRFGDIQIYVVSDTEEGVELLISVEELPYVNTIEFVGNKKLSDNTLKDAVTLKTGQMLSDAALFQAVQDLKAEYLENHFHQVEIDTETKTGAIEFSEDVVFKIKENRKLKIRSIDFDGNEQFTDRKLRRRFKNSKPWRFYIPWRGKFDEVKFDEDKDALIDFYRSKGYRDFRILSTDIAPSQDPRGLLINLQVFEGAKYFFRNISWEGNIIHTVDELAHRLGFEKGDVYDELQFEIALSEQVSPLYMDDGYFYFGIEPVFTPVGDDSLDVHFIITENKKVRVRKILISGNDRTHENVIRRELRVFPGDIFNRTKLIDSYRDIIMLDYFENVLPEVVPVSDEEIDLKIEVIEKSADRANFSISYNETYGFTGGGGVEFRNFRGRGQTLSLNYTRGIGSGSSSSTSTYSSYYDSDDVASYESFSMSFVDPWLFDTPNLVGMSAYYSERGQGQGNYYPFDIQNSGGSIRFGRRFKWPDRFFRGSWNLKISNSKYIADEISDLTDYFSGYEHLIKEEESGNYSFRTAGISISQVITRDSRNHPEFPTAGSKLTWASTFSGSFLGGDEDYHKHEIGFDWFNPTFGKFVLHQQYLMGVIKAIPVSGDQRSVIPPSARFLMGGTGMPYGEMMRGYEDNTVGPMGISQPQGGNLMLKYSAELRLQFSNNPTVYGLVFGEAGNVWGDFSTIDPFDLKRSAGCGVRMYMPMLGMLGFDIGYGFDDTIYDSDSKPQGWNYHLLFGMPF